MTEGSAFSFLAWRADIARDNEEWARRELGDSVAVLDLGCAALDGCTKVVADRVGDQGNEASQAERAISLLAMLAVSRAGNVCSLLLQGYPVDAGALLRGLLEIEAMQRRLGDDSDSAERWMNNEQIREAEYLRTVTRADSTFGPMWGQLGKFVHPNRLAVINQANEAGGRTNMSGGGAKRPEQLLKLAANFGTAVTREVQFLEGTFAIEWPADVAAVVLDFEKGLDELNAEVLRRWPGSTLS